MLELICTSSIYNIYRIRVLTFLISCIWSFDLNIQTSNIWTMKFSHWETSQGPVSFCAREHDHWTRPFRERRVVLVLFSLQGFSHLSDEDARCLAQLGFPTKEALASKQVSEPMSLPARASSLPARDACRPGNALLSDVQQAASLGCNSLTPQGPSEDPMPRPKVPRLAPRLDRQAPLLLEICAGSAALSSTASQRGWDVVPVDQASCRFTPRTPLVILDLRDPSSLDVLLGFDSASPADWIHLGLPCWTCSRGQATTALGLCEGPMHCLACQVCEPLRPSKLRLRTRCTEHASDSCFAHTRLEH